MIEDMIIKRDKREEDMREVFAEAPKKKKSRWKTCLLYTSTSVTELVTEEREEGKVFLRATRIGDISHLYAGSEEPAFAGRFCETYDNWEERH